MAKIETKKFRIFLLSIVFIKSIVILKKVGNYHLNQQNKFAYPKLVNAKVGITISVNG